MTDDKNTVAYLKDLEQENDTLQAKVRELEERLRQVVAEGKAISRLNVEQAVEISNLKAKLRQVEEERDTAIRALHHHGYKKSCDIPACNCGDQWLHGGHAGERLRAIGEVLPFTNGATILQRVKQVLEERDQWRLRVGRFVEFFKDNFENAGEELFGRVNGQELTLSAVRLNDLIAKAKRALEGKEEHGRRDG